MTDLPASAVTITPGYFFFENYYFYTYPTAALLTFATLALARFVREHNVWWGCAYYVAGSLVVLLNSTFQWPWLVGVALPVVLVYRLDWRRMVIVLLIPLLCVGTWYGKNIAMFGSYSTSSWLGMNLVRTTTGTGGGNPPVINELVESHALQAISWLPPFGAVTLYIPKYVAPRPSPVHEAVVDRASKSDGSPNFNDAEYIAISNAFLKNDLRYIAREPTRYASNVMHGAAIFSMPADQYNPLISMWGHTPVISEYVSLFDRIPMLQFAPTGVASWKSDPQQAADLSIAKLLTNVSWTMVLELGIVLFGTPVLAWRKRSLRSYSVTLAFIWFTTVYVFLATTLVELGENNRFRLDLGPLPLVAAIAVAMAVLRPWLNRRFAGDAPPQHGEQDAESENEVLVASGA